MKRLRPPSTTALFLGALAVFFSVGCGDDTDAAPIRDADNFRTQARGEACSQNTDCQTGLFCEEEVCAYRADAAEGETCAVTLQCTQGLYCDSATGQCQPSGMGTAGTLCDSTADCEAGLECTARGLTSTCQPRGEGDRGQACKASAECLAGLECLPTPEGGTQCTGGPMAVPMPWSGVNCEASSMEEGPARFFFEVPGDTPSAEFFRLPFPNDARLTMQGRPDLSGFPSPGTGVLGFDIVQTYVDAIETGQRGWGTNQAIFVRSSVPIDFETLEANDDADTPDINERTLSVVDITPDSPTYGERQPLFWQARGGNGSAERYICQNWLAVRSFWGRPLRPDTTYALIIDDGVRASSGDALTQDPDFTAMLAADQPTDARLQRAWRAYEPLRTFVDAQPDLTADDLLVATVFTTQDPFTTTAQLREVVRGADPEITEAWTLCNEGVTSPCDDGLEGEAHRRGCFAAQSGFDELHTKISLPIVQRGQPPYLDEGGGVAATPSVERSEDVCVAMTVPDGPEMPKDGWPILVYAHGTGGTYRSGATRMAPLLSEITLPDGTTTGVITLGWDQVQHFTRRGGSTQNPEPLVFNYANPPATRGNFIQGGADLHAIIAAIEELDIPEAISPTGEALKIDPTHIYFMGNSQGGTTGSLVLPFEPSVRAAILSGSGGGLILGLLGKTSPVDSPTSLRVALQDPTINDVHPAINLVQGYFEAVDPINYGPLLAEYQLDRGSEGKHVFHIFGLGDTFTPPAALKAMARSLYATYLGPILEEMGGGVLIREEGIVRRNREVGDTRYTVVGRQYEPEAMAYDGHFVIFRDELAQADLIQFLSTAIGEGAPTLGEEEMTQ